MGIKAARGCVIAAGHLAALAIEFAAEFADVKTPGKPSAYSRVHADQRGNLVGETACGLFVGLALDEVG